MIRVALVCDPLEEQWPSMDLVADMLYRCLNNGHPDLQVKQLRLPMARVSTGGAAKNGGLARTAERLLHRFLRYPLWLRRQSANYDVFHILDHTYSQLVHETPADRTVVSCHDLDAFRCILSPEREKRSLPFRVMSKRILQGLTKAAQILCDSQAIHDELTGHHLVPAERVSVVLHGTHPTCNPLPDPEADAEVTRLLQPKADSHYLLHVGSTIPRKRIDILLKVFAAARKSQPALELIRVGGAFTPPQEQLAQQLGVRDFVRVLPHIDREVLAAVYRRADFLLLTSDAEGFGLPVVEAMACGCPVVASDLPVLREIGGVAAAFCPVDDIEAWSKILGELLVERSRKPADWKRRLDGGFLNAARFTWENSAAQCAEIYKGIYKNGRLKQQL
jgi:glycosyltransferase involved in cell wall biosynthesis